MKDSILAESFVPSYGFSHNKFVDRNSYSAIVIHTTGYGPVRKHHNLPHKYGSPLGAAVSIYERMPYSPHYVLGQDGTIVQMCPEELSSWHVGSSRGWRYDTPRWATKRYQWWFNRWEGLSTPKELAGGSLWLPYPESALSGKNRYFRKIYWSSLRGSVNANTIGIEVVPPTAGPTRPWSGELWRALRLLVQDIHRRREVPLEKHYVVTHSDCCPVSRTTRKGIPWDTWSTQWSWNKFLEEF